MRNIGIVTSQEVTAEMVKDFVEAFPGGVWFVHDGTEQGAFYRDDLHVHVSPDTKLSPFYDPEEIEALTKALSGPPCSTIEISYKSSEETQFLADDVAKSMLKAWSGVIDNDVLQSVIDGALS